MKQECFQIKSIARKDEEARDLGCVSRQNQKFKKHTKKTQQFGKKKNGQP